MSMVLWMQCLLDKMERLKLRQELIDTMAEVFLDICTTLIVPIEDDDTADLQSDLAHLTGDAKYFISELRQNTSNFR